MDTRHFGMTARATLVALSVWLLPGTPVAAEPDWAAEKTWADGMDVGKAALEGLKFTEARDAYAKALEATKEFPADDPRRRATLNKLAAAYNGLGAYDKSEPLLREALDLWEKAGQPGDLELATTLHNLAGVFYAEGSYEKARPYLKWALAIRQKLLPPKHPAIEHTKRSIETLTSIAGTEPDEPRRAEPAPAPALTPAAPPAPAPAAQPAAKTVPKPTAAQPASPTPAPTRQEAVKAEAPKKPAPQKPEAATAEAPQAEAQKAPAGEAPKPAAKAEPSAAPATQTAKAVDGGFLVHLASYKSPDKAEAGWVGLQRVFPDQLGKRTPVLRRVDLGDQGIFHRLLAGGFASRDDAQALCDQLKAKEQYCMVVRK